jgi:hypothetical protein
MKKPHSQATLEELPDFLFTK